MSLLYNHFPELAAAVPHTPLAELPTPVRPLADLSGDYPDTHLFLKDDGCTAPSYGGNKVRKLEFLLGEALTEDADTTITFGFAGSNHALATAVHARACGMVPVSVLLHQPNAAYVRKNLLYSLAVGTRIVECGNFAELLGGADHLAAEYVKAGKKPIVIPPGGSSPLGNLGYVNAAFELNAQINAGELPVPDIIYLPLGTMGTVCGLALGLKLAGLKIPVQAVCVVDPDYATMDVCRSIFAETRNFLAESVPEVATVSLEEGDIAIDNGFLGTGYAEFTKEGVAAVKLLQEREGVILEGSYSGKTMAALLADAGSGTLAGKNVLFWKTCNSADFSTKIAGADYHGLPASFQRYFTSEVQPLDS